MNRAGARAEDQCAEMMRAAGLALLARNWRCRFGEIDLIAEERGIVVFAEVRMRRSWNFGGAGKASRQPSGPGCSRRRGFTWLRGRRRHAGSTSSSSRGRRATSGGCAMRSASSTMLLLFAFATGAWADSAVRLIVQSSPLAGFRYYDAAEVWKDMRVGDRLELARESGNPHDANAVSVSWRGRKLGYVPRRENAALAWGLDRGEALEARVSRLAAHPNPSRRVEFEVYVK